MQTGVLSDSCDFTCVFNTALCFENDDYHEYDYLNLTRAY